MFKKVYKTWIRVLALAVLMVMVMPMASHAAKGDDTIKDSVHKALNPYHDVGISVDNGEVTLKGNVSSAGEKAEALAKARAVSGVREIKDEIRVVGGKDSQTVGEYVDDAAVTAKVKAELITVKDLESNDISVNTRDGVVMLTGNVKDANQANMVEQKVRAVSGVKSVDNRLTVKK